MQKFAQPLPDGRGSEVVARKSFLSRARKRMALLLVEEVGAVDSFAFEHDE